MSEQQHVPPQQEASTETEPPLRESWMRAFVRGSNRVPQDYLGSYLMVLSALTEDPPSSWEEFALSRVSEKQYEELQKHMRAAHKHSGVALMDASYERFEEGWITVKYHIYGKLAKYVFENKGEDIDRYLADPHAAEFASLTKLIVTAADALSDPSVIALCDERKAQIKQDVDGLRTLKEEVHEAWRRAFVSRINDSGIGPIPSDIRATRFLQISGLQSNEPSS